MKIRYLKLYALTISSVFLVSSCIRKAENSVIITLGQREIKNSGDQITGDTEKTARTSIHLVQAGGKSSTPVNLTADFFSARSPVVSCDGTRMLFAAQKLAGDNWQIWEMNLGNKKSYKVISVQNDCKDLTYLPVDRVAFIMQLKNDSLMAEQAIFTCNLDGSDLRRITFNPGYYRFLTIMRDGRLLVAGGQSYPERGKEILIAMRPDGTKPEMFFSPEDGESIISKPCESSDGTIFFSRSSANIGSGTLTTISYNRPLHSRKDIPDAESGSYDYVTAPRTGAVLVSVRDNKDGASNLFEFDMITLKTAKKLFSDNDNNILEIAKVEASERPKKLPSEVDMEVKTGLMLCQNVNLTGLNSPENIENSLMATKIEILGINKSLGLVDVEKDGSFYIKIIADTPFRIRSLDEAGKTVNGPGTWLYIRPNERRGCVGCHEDQEIVPSNRMAMAVLKQAVGVPVIAKGIKEKVVELE